MNNKIIISLCLMLSVVSTAVCAENSLYDVPLSFRADSNASFSLKQLQGTPVILTMAYASCRSACPVMMKRLKKLDELLNEKKLAAALVIVSLSPERDTTEAMKLFKKEHGLVGDRWHFIRGDEDTTRQFSNLIEYNYQKKTPIARKLCILIR